MQVAELVERVRCASEPKSNGNGLGPVQPLVVICGDFNTTPDNIACKVRFCGAQTNACRVLAAVVKCFCIQLTPELNFIETNKDKFVL
jgi:hypothetical protein